MRKNKGFVEEMGWKQIFIDTHETVFLFRVGKDKQIRGLRIKMTKKS